VDKALGLSPMRSGYEKCKSLESTNAGPRNEAQKALSAYYKSIKIDYGFEFDMLMKFKGWHYKN